MNLQPFSTAGLCVHTYIYGAFPKLGVPFRGPNNKDYSILGSILGSPILGNYHIYIHIYIYGTPPHVPTPLLLYIRNTGNRIV